jgi:hypothetical protein
VDEAQVGQQQAVVVLLVDDGVTVDDEERGAVGQLDLLERVLLGQHLVDVRGEERVGGQDGLADRALDRGLELLFGGAVEALQRDGGLVFGFLFERRGLLLLFTCATGRRLRRRGEG